MSGADSGVSRAVHGNARQLVHGIGLRDDLGNQSADRQRDGLLEFAVLRFVGHPDQFLRRAEFDYHSHRLQRDGRPAGRQRGQSGVEPFLHDGRRAVGRRLRRGASRHLFRRGTAGGSVYCDDVALGPSAAGPSNFTAGSISNSGTLTVGPTNTVTIGGAFTQTSTGTLDVQLGGAPSTGSFGFVNVSGAATLAGTLKADIVYGYSPSTTDTLHAHRVRQRIGELRQR